MNDIPIEVIVEINRRIINEWLDFRPEAHDVIDVNKERLQEALDIANKLDNLIL
jgi:hypothetical protein